jgi:hypothetical protein
LDPVRQRPRGLLEHRLHRPGQHGPQRRRSATLAEYRDIYIPIRRPFWFSPRRRQTVPINSMVSYSVGIESAQQRNPDLPVAAEWLVIPNETNATLTLANLTAADTGLYSVNAGNDGGGTLSAAASLIVSNALPLVVGETLNTTQNVAVTVSASSLLNNDTDPEGAMLSILGVNGVCSTLLRANFDHGLPPNTTPYLQCLCRFNRRGE